MSVDECRELAWNADLEKVEEILKQGNNLTNYRYKLIQAEVSDLLAS